MPAVALHVVVLPAQTELLPPVIAQIGSGFTTNVLAQVLWQPFASVIVTVYVPAVEMVPVLCVVAVKPPGPVHAYVVMPAVAEKLVVDPIQIELLPVIVQTGSGFTVSVLAHVLWQPFASVMVTVYVPATLIVIL